MLWKLDELFSSSNATSRTFAIVYLEFVDGSKIAPCSLLSLLFAISEHLLPNLTDSNFLSLNLVVFEIAPEFG
jgi:hypothetical protein